MTLHISKTYSSSLFLSGATVWIWTSEIFSMNVRAQAVGMSSQMQNVSNAIVNQIFPLILNDIGFKAMYMFAGINLLLATFIYFFIPETKGVKLESMDTLFGSVNHIEKGAQIVEEHGGTVFNRRGHKAGVEKDFTVGELEVSKGQHGGLTKEDV